MKVNEALKITDSFTRTSKMPGLSYSLPAWACKTGQKLAKIPGTPCYGCYACLLYTSPSPRDVEESRMPSSA